MKTRWMHLIAGFTMFVLCISVCTTTSDATVIWEDDDFSDGWLMNEKMNVTDGMLRYIGPSTFGHAFHNSSVNVGTWEFDIIEFDSERDYVNVMFVANVDRVSYTLFDGYFVSLTRSSENIRYKLYKAFDYPNLALLDSYDAPATDPTIHRIKVSREATHGQINVYINETIRMQADGGLPSEDPFGSEPVFYFFASRDVALDNIVVDNETDPYTTPTPTTPIPTAPPILWVLMAIGGGVAAVVIVLAIVCLRRR